MLSDAVRLTCSETHFLSEKPMGSRLDWEERAYWLVIGSWPPISNAMIFRGW